MHLLTVFYTYTHSVIIGPAHFCLVENLLELVGFLFWSMDIISLIGGGWAGVGGENNL